MKSPRRLYFLIFIIIFVLSCNDQASTPNNDSFIDQLQAIGELELIQNEEMHALLGQLVVTDLEHLNTPSDSLENDSYFSGIDIIPFYFHHSATHTFSLDTSAYFSLKLINPTTDQVLVDLTPENNEVQLDIDEGFYELHLSSHLHYGSDTLTSQPIFIIPEIEEIEVSRKGAKILENVFQYMWLFISRWCEGCDLRGSDLSGWYLAGVKLSAANLSYAHLYGTNLSWADLRNANLFSSGRNDK